MRNAPIRPDGTCVTAQQLRVRGPAPGRPSQHLQALSGGGRWRQTWQEEAAATAAAEVIGVLLQSPPPPPPILLEMLISITPAVCTSLEHTTEEGGSTEGRFFAEGNYLYPNKVLGFNALPI